jgi:hypothetical protein
VGVLCFPRSLLNKKKRKEKKRKEEKEAGKQLPNGERLAAWQE